MSQTTTECPCGKPGNSFNKCCAPILEGTEKAQTVEQLMRARYSAYVMENMDFIATSHDPKTRKDNDMETNKEWAKSTKWLELEILSIEKGSAEDDEGQVEFKAKFEKNGKEDWHHEMAYFNRRKGEWFFTDGKKPNQKTIVRDGNKVGRNDPCHCGSQKKFKKCCGKN